MENSIKYSIDLSEVRFGSEKSRAYCVATLNRAVEWANFDQDQPIRACVNSDKVLTGFFSERFHFGYTDLTHTLDETLHSPYEVAQVTFRVFRAWALSAAA